MKSLCTAAAAADWQQGHRGAASVSRGSSGDGQILLLLLYLEHCAITPGVYHMALQRETESAADRSAPKTLSSSR